MHKRLLVLSVLVCMTGLFIFGVYSASAFFATAPRLRDGASPQPNVQGDPQSIPQSQTTTTTTTTTEPQDQPVVPQDPQPVPATTTTTTTTTSEPQAQPVVTPQSQPVPTTTTTTTTEPQAHPVVMPQSHPVPTATTTTTEPQAHPVVQPQAAPKPFSGKKAVERSGVKPGDVSFNFDDADVFSVIQTIFGDVMKVNYIVDPSIKGRVNFRSVAPVAREDVFPLMEVILRLNGIAVVEEGGLYRIIPIGDISKEPALVGNGRDAEEVQTIGKALVQVVPVLYGQSTELTRVLTPFLSKNAMIIDVPKGNYIILIDTDANVKRLLELVKIFDNEKLKQATPKVFVYSIQNSKAKDVSAILQQIFLGGKSSQPSQSSTASAQKPAGTQPGGAGQPPQQPVTQSAQPQVISGQAKGESLVAESTKIIPDDITNSIIVLASPEDYLLIYDTLQKIDVVPRQVMIEALIAEITLSKDMEFGMQWTIDNNLTIKGVKPFPNDINVPGAFNLITPIASPNFTFVSTALNAAGQVKLQLSSLASQSKVKVLSSPHILVSDNREAKIQVGDQVPISTSTTTTTAVAGIQPSITSTIQYTDTGVILKVKPQVNDSGLIALELSQEVSDYSIQSLFGSDQIVISKRSVNSNLVVQDGQTIVIGGLIKENITKGRAGLPFLSNIPVLGYLFGSTTDTDIRTELIVLLTPHVIKNQADAKDVTTGYINRIKGLNETDIKSSEITLPGKGSEKK